MSMVMPWGRYRNTPISDVGSSYLCFVLESCSPAPDLQQAIRAELQSRFGAQLPPPRSRSDCRSCPDPDLARSLVTAGLHALARKYHPDTAGGDTATMQRLNATADWLKARLP
jgi:hypothetical protein